MARQTAKGDLRRKTKYVLSASTATLIVSLLGSAGVGDGQATTLWNPVKTTCNLRFAQGTIVGDKMFVTGGEQTDQLMYQKGIDTPYPKSAVIRWQNKHLWELDLSAKFNTSKPPWTANPKPEDWTRHYNGAQGTLWNLGGDTFYTLGGWMANAYEGPPGGHRIAEPYFTSVKAADGSTTYKFQLPPIAIHAYNTTTANWTSISVSPSIHRLSDIGYTQSKRNKVGYTLGGYQVVEQRDGGTNKNFIPPFIDQRVWHNSLSAYDFRKNIFNTSDVHDDIGPTINVMLHSLDRVGDEGVLIALAGKSKNMNLEDYRPTNEIWIYDIASSKWMKQAATGDIPRARYRSCSALVPAPDFSSYQIYMFSGITRGDVRILDMYVLSIPAFVWRKIDLVNYPDGWGIGDTTCALYEDRQFIIVPGDVNVSTAATVNDTFFLKCNMGTAVHVFDTYDWTFKAEFDPDNKGSKVPPAIVDLIGGNEKGNAKLQQPKSGWDIKELGPIFKIRNQLPADIDGSVNNTTTSTDSPPHQEDRQNTDGNESESNNGAIAGGIVGGFVGLSLLLGFLFWWRKRQGAEQTALPELGANGAPPYYHSPHNTPSKPSMPPQELQSYKMPQELQAYEPPEMGGAG